VAKGRTLTRRHTRSPRRGARRKIKLPARSARHPFGVARFQRRWSLTPGIPRRRRIQRFSSAAIQTRTYSGQLRRTTRAPFRSRAGNEWRHARKDQIVRSQHHDRHRPVLHRSVWHSSITFFSVESTADRELRGSVHPALNLSNATIVRDATTGPMKRPRLFYVRW